MFDRLQRELQRLAEAKISVPIEADAEGYYDKECPAETCLFGFKIHGDDWRAVVRDDEVFCPLCRHEAPATHWHPRAQLEQAKAYAVNELERTMGRAMREDAAAWNRRQPRNAFITMTMKVQGYDPPAVSPIAATEPLRLRAACEACGCRYSYVGAAYFCPACGRNSAGHMFGQTLTAIRTSAGNADKLRAAFPPDEAEVLVQTLLEKAMQDTVTSFQRVAERAYEKFRSAPKARRNAFQNLDEGSSLWATASGRSYADILDPADLRRLRTYFQQRHLLSHTQGIVDQDYVIRSGDGTYKVGQRLVLSAVAVLDFATLTETLGTALLTGP